MESDGDKISPMARSGGFLRTVSFVLFLMFSISFVSAGLGVRPPSYELNFQPGLESESEFGFYSDEPGAEFDVLLEGNLASYTTIDKPRINGSEIVTVTLKLPQALEPGLNRVFVVGRQVLKDQGRGAGVGARVSIYASVIVYVPYPGKYAEIGGFETWDANFGEEVQYSLEIFSRGEDDITASTEINVFDADGKGVAIYGLGTGMIPGQESTILRSTLDTSELDPGNYKAVATVNYPGNTQDPIKSEDDFRLGELVFNIVNTSAEVGRDGIFPFHIEVESLWNDPVEGVHADVLVVGTDISFPTPSANIPGFGKKRLTGYVDTSEIEMESFQVKVTLHYEGKTSEKIVNVSLKKKERNYTLIGLIIAVMLLALGFIIWTVLKLKKLERRGKKK